MSALREYLARTARFAETRSGAGLVFAAALLAWWIQAIAVPLTGGRDFGTYLGAYDQLFANDPIDIGYVLGRTPIAPLVVGGLLEFLGGALAEPVMSLLYAASILAWFLAARRFGGAAALLATAVLLPYPGYGILFHELSSDAVFAAAFAGWSLLAVRTLDRPSMAAWALLGAGVAMLTLVRPVNQALVALALLAFLFGVSWRTRVLWACAFVVPLVAIVGAWTVHNGARFGDYTLVRSSGSWPIFRVYLEERIVRPENGEASRELARAVSQDLLPAEPYRSYGITIQRFFEDPTPRMLEDLGALADRRWGWHSDQKILGEVAREAIRAEPATYARGVASTVSDLLRLPVYRSLGTSDEASSSGETGEGGGATIVVDGRVLPKPSEGEAIPAPNQGGPTTPDGSIRTVWTSPYEHHLVFDHPGDAARYAALHRRIDELARNLPDRAGSATLALRMNQASRWYPPPVLWLLAGLVAVAIRRPRDVLALSTPSIAALIVIVVSATGVPAVPHFSVPVMPAFALFMGGALFGPRRT
jgi:hypothetical protein